MTIRRILLAAFLGVGILPAAVLTAWSFTRTQAAMRAEIEHSLMTQAAVSAADLDKQLFERLQNAVSWARLDVMQDLHVGDVDKRLAGYLAEMKLSYGGVYVDLHATDMDGRVVASSDPSAIGRRLDFGPIWQQARMAGGTVTAEAPRRRADGREILLLRLPVPSQFSDSPLGQLVLLVNWSQVGHSLDAAAGERRTIAVVDATGRLVVASNGLHTSDGAASMLAADWLVTPGAAVERDGAPLIGGTVIVGSARGPGSGPFAGLGWTTLVLEPSRAALAPVHRMAASFFVLLLITAAATVPLAFWVSQRIARPIVRLTDYTRGFMRQQQPTAPPAASGEVGELTRAFTHMVDDLDASRQTLVRASQLAAIGEFAAMMAHEIRTPLGILRSSAQMLQQEAGLSAEGRELTGFIVSETQRLNGLVGTLLDSARASPPRRAAENIEALIERSLTLLAHQAQHQQVVYERQFEAADPVAVIDGEQLLQVLLNLELNALQAMPRGGRLSVATRGDQDWLVIEVADNGPGIAAAERPHVFEPFVYRREGGLGLGLAVVKQIVTAHGGDITVDAAASGGALFRIRLPR
ncbi:sensor histidine kinase [Immundisolibacter sp.]